MVIALLCVAPAAAVAQIDQVIVTATKREADAQNVPIAVQAVDGEDLKALRATAAEDVLALFSNLSINGSNQLNKGFTIRGVGTNNFHGNVNQAVGVYQDEVSLSTPFSGGLSLYDIARVEVMRGPQNTLFGRNTTGGAINYVSNLPTVGGGTTGYLRATAAEDAQLDLEGAIGLDLGRSAAGRLSFQSLDRDGLFTNMAPGREGEDLGSVDRLSARMQVLWEPTASTEVLFNAHVFYNRGDSLGNKAIGLRDPNDASLPCDRAEIVRGSDYQTRNNCAAANGFNPSSDDWTTVYNVSGAQADIDIEGSFIKLTHGFDSGYTLTSISAIEYTRVQQVEDAGGFNEPRLTPNQDAEYEQYSQEFRIASPDGESLRWLAGLYYFQEDMVLGTNVVNSGAGVIASNILDQEDTDLSVYGQLDLDVTDRLTLGIGLRYTDNEKEAPSSIFRVLPRGPNGLTDPTQFITNEIVVAATVVPVSIPFIDLESDLNELGGKLYASYQIGDGVMIYGSYSEGFKAGGFDTRAIAALTPGGNPGLPVEPEFLSAWEAGIKSTLAGGSLQLNASAFFYDWEDLQTFVVVGGVPGFANIPESELKGIEIEARWAPDDAWLIVAGAGFLDTEVTDAGNLTSSVDVGHELTNAPEFSANLSLIRDVNINSGALRLRADVSHRSEHKDTLLFATDDFSIKDATTFVSASGIWTFGDDERYEVSLWAENLTEERTCFDIGLVDNPQVTMGQLSSTGACAPSPGQRRFGLSGQVRF
ncbi:MAG: TonB-dependent receptor [Woeseiaceae bacterium]|nr:TonB-dependent receptor [Woeseiaceae bacterium]